MKRIFATVCFAATLLIARADDAMNSPGATDSSDTNGAPAASAAPAAPTPNASSDLNAPPAVQIDVKSLLNARVVTTFSDGKVVPLAIALDGAGGVATAAAAQALGIDNPHTVPDDGHFPANADHPDVVLNFSDADGSGPQVRRMGPPDDFAFDVPPNNYAKMFLFFTSGAAGPAPLAFTLTYQDGSSEVHNEVCPDWWTELKGPDKDVIYLAANLAKFGTKNKVLEKDHHNIWGLDIHPDPSKVLVKVAVHKTKPLVCFWGATGQPVK